MDAGRALADLVEISPQIEAAAIVTGETELAGSVGVPDARASVLTRSVRELLEGAAAFRSDAGPRHAAARGAGGWRPVRGERCGRPDGRRRDGGRASPGLVFYDLKRCLAAVADET